MTGPSDNSSAPSTMWLRNLDPRAPALRSAYSRSKVRSKTNVNATKSRKISAETAAKITVSSLVSGCRKVRLNVACAKMMANRKKRQMQSATIAGVRLGFCFGRIGGVDGNIAKRYYYSPIAMLPSTPPIRPKQKPNRTPAIVALCICLFFLFAIIFAQATFNLTFLQPDTSEETVIFAAVSALIFLLFVALTFVLLRTLLRLYAERKAGALGSKFRSHMVLGALLLSLGPVIFLFLFSYGLMNRSVEKWFSRPVEDVQYRTNAIVSLLTQYAATNADAEARRIAATPDAQKSFQTGNFSFMMDEF